MGISSIILKCPCCKHKSNVHVIPVDNNNLAICAKCYSSIGYVGKKLTGKGDKCCYCERQVPKLRKTREHLYPQSVHGSDHPDNIQVCCLSCNQWRANKPYIQWAREVEAYITTGKGTEYRPWHIMNILKNVELIQEFIFNNLNNLKR